MNVADRGNNKADRQKTFRHTRPRGVYAGMYKVGDDAINSVMNLLCGYL